LYKYGGIISFGKMISNQSEYVNINYEEKSNYFGYGAYLLRNFDNSYLMALFHSMNMKSKYFGYTGLDLSLEEKCKNSFNLSNVKIEYGFGKKEKVVLGISRTVIDDYSYETQVINPLWIRRVLVEELESTEGYIGWDAFKKTEKDSYYFTLRFCQVLSGDSVSSYEEIQGVSKLISQKLPRNNLKIGMYYNTSSNLFLGLKAEINSHYQKYAIKVGRNF
ncbi:MAG: hypothetical protein NZM44_02085, partial [Candidatus Calescibacterium sp.]|nr:hypothetical protein [Candidatus Calescibacterium sp.]